MTIANRQTPFPVFTQRLFDAFVLPFLNQAPAYNLTSDGIIETPVGCFCLAGLEINTDLRKKLNLGPQRNPQGDQIIGLLYARHRDGLAADASGTLSTPGYILIAASWIAAKDSMLSKHQIIDHATHITHELPWRYFITACLHRLGETGAVSKFLGYYTEGMPGKDREIFLSPFIDSKTGLPFFPDEDGSIADAPFFRRVRSLFRQWYRLTLAVHEQGRCIPLEAPDARETREGVLHDFRNKLELIAAGIQPLNSHDIPYLPVLLAMNNAAQKARHYQKMARNKEWNYLRHNLGPLISRFVISNFTHIVENTVAKHFWLSNAYEDMPSIESRLHPMVAKRIPVSRMIPIRSGLIGRLLAPLSDGYRAGWKRFDSERMQTIFAGEPIVERTREDVFAHWLSTYIINPYAASLRYTDANGTILDPSVLSPEEMEKRTATIRTDLSNGVTLHMKPDSQIFFAQFYATKYDVSDRTLPEDASFFFGEDRLVRIDLSLFLRYLQGDSGGKGYFAMVNMEDVKTEFNLPDNERIKYLKASAPEPRDTTGPKLSTHVRPLSAKTAHI